MGQTYKFTGDLGTCMSLDKAIESCARYFDQSTPCAGFFSVNDGCGPNQLKYSFSSTFIPKKNAYAYNSSLTSSDNLLTPSAVQLVFSAQGMKALEDGTPSNSMVGDCTVPAQKCADDSSCSAYQFKC